MVEEEEELREEIESLKSQLNVMEGMLHTIMDMHKNVLEKVSTDTSTEKRYLRMLSLYKRYGRISPSLIPEIDDPISESIVEVLLDKETANITQITEQLREKRGSASRHTVRDRLKKLEKKGVVVEHDEGHGRTYKLTDRILEKWAKVLGIKK